MKSKNILTLSIAFAACALLYLGSASAQNSTAADSVDPSVPTSVAQNEASQMVAADAILDNGIDAKKVQPGEQFRATLRDTVHLKNGTELPRDTVLVGTTENDAGEFTFPSGQSTKGRLWDVLTMLRFAIRSHRDTDRVDFKVAVEVKGDGKHETVCLWALIGPGDTASPVLTIMLETED